MDSSNDQNDSFQTSAADYDDSDITNDESESSGSQDESDWSESNSDGSNGNASSSDEDIPIARGKQRRRQLLISDDESNDDKSSALENKSSSAINNLNSFVDSNLFADESHQNSSKIQAKRDLLSQSSASTSNTSKINSGESPNISHGNQQKKNTLISDDDDDKPIANKSSLSTFSMSNTSKHFSSFVGDKGLLDDDYNTNTTTESPRRKSRNSKRSSNRSFAKSFTNYRSKSDSQSSDEGSGSNTNSQINQLSGTDEQIEKRRSAIQKRNVSSDLEVNDSSDDELFEKEFQRNVYSPKTRMSITGIANVSDVESDSEVEYLKPSVISEEDSTEPIEIPDSDDEAENNAAKPSDVNTSNRFLDLTKFNTSDLKNPLQASSPLPQAKPKLQPKITTVAKVYVSQEFFDKQVIKLNDMENELQKSVQLRGAFQVKLPDDGRRLSGRIDRLKLDIEQQQKYIQSLEIQTSFEQNEIKPAPTKIIEVSWDALDAATNEVKPKYTGKVGLSNFNTQKAMTLDTLKEIHESISSCPSSDTFAEDPEGLKIELMPHQKHALAWLEWRETQRPRGGILADDMGLGKTLTIIAHVLAANYRKENCSDEDSDERDNPHEGWTSKGRKDHYAGGTLVVCPASLIGQWEFELKNRVNRNFISHVVHHGTKRDVKPKYLAKADMVITTYNIVARECGENGNGALANIKWERVVLDEAHVIRNPKTRMSESVSSLKRRCNWLLTGTPIQNKEMDMFSLFRFLKCRPFDDLGQFKKWIDNKNAGGQLRMNTILKAILLRRTKVELIANGGLLTMPTKTIHIVEVTLEKDEMNVYQKIMLYSRTLFGQYLYQRAEKGDLYDYKKAATNTNFHKAHQMMMQMHSGDRDVKTHEILVLLLRLRQICCHPGLITAMLQDEDKSTVFEDSNSEQDSLDIDLMEQLNKLNVNENENGSASFELPVSDTRVTKASQKVLLKSNPVFDFSRPSSKFLKVLEVLKKNVLPKNENAVIVSQWTYVLEIIGMTLRREGISYSSLTGSVPVKDRGAIVEHFNRHSQQSKVLLLSLTAGGVGLNLMGGNHLLLLDLHWNPQLEAQAQDRVYRVGQTKPVSIYKFVCTNTIEQRIQKLQDRKLEIANGVLTGSSTKGSKLTIDDLKSLFDL